MEKNKKILQKHINPVVDIVFKAIFGRVGKEFIAIDLLNCVFRYFNLPQIKSAEIQNPYS